MTLKSSPLIAPVPAPAIARPLRPSIALLLLLLLGLTVSAPTAGAQGVTTSAVTGFVRGQDGLPLADAMVVAVHVPSGTQYRTAVTGPAARTACPTCASAARTASPPP